MLMVSADDNIPVMLVVVQAPKRRFIREPLSRFLIWACDLSSCDRFFLPKSSRWMSCCDAIEACVWGVSDVTSSNNEDPGSGKEEKSLAQKRRGRPQKLSRDELDKEEVEKIEEEDGDDAKLSISSKEKEDQASSEKGNKRKRNSRVRGKLDLVKEQKDIGTRSSGNDLTKLNGFRHNGSRRKRKPCRAAEVGVECKAYCGIHVSFFLVLLDLISP
ncbi:hypothetical protein NL676_031462 [Syzygium grande]|nr:hypothetical protein NL676_031462 [Syzygium grande]